MEFSYDKQSFYPNSSQNLKLSSGLTTVKVHPKYLSRVIPSFMSGRGCSLYIFIFEFLNYYVLIASE